MTYRETIMDNLSKTRDAISATKSLSLDSESKVLLHLGYIDKAIMLLKQDREKIDTLSHNLDAILTEKEAVKPKSGIFLCFCGRCGNPMQKTDYFCSKCGKEIDWQ